MSGKEGLMRPAGARSPSNPTSTRDCIPLILSANPAQRRQGWELMWNRHSGSILAMLRYKYDLPPDEILTHVDDAYLKVERYVAAHPDKFQSASDERLAGYIYKTAKRRALRAAKKRQREKNWWRAYRAAHMARVQPDVAFSENNPRSSNEVASDQTALDAIMAPIDWLSLSDRMNEHQRTPEERLEEQEFYQRLGRAMNRLPDKQQTCLWFHLRGYNDATIAEKLRIKQKGTVRSNICFAKKALRRLLDDER